MASEESKSAVPSEVALQGWVAAMLKPPARVGDDESAIETPCLVVDLDAFEDNLARMNASLKPYPDVALRPHCKSHKCPDIAKLQIAAAAQTRGVCCQKVIEAEAMVAGGVLDILLSNQVVGASKMARITRLVKAGAAITIIVDDASNVAAWAEAAAAAGVVLPTLVEMDVGQKRCGVATPADAVKLGKTVTEHASLSLKGLQCYHGAAQHIRTTEDRKGTLSDVVEKTKLAVAAFKEAGLCVDIVTGGGTGTYLLEAASGVFTEVQPGSYIFNDVDYSRNLDDAGAEVSDSLWAHSLFILSTVMSRSPARGWAVLDAGLKSMSVDSGAPRLSGGSPAVAFGVLSDEHGNLVMADEAADPEAELPKLGAKVRLIPGHCDPTVNHHDFIAAVRKGKVEAVWRVLGRSPGF